MSQEGFLEIFFDTADNFLDTNESNIMKNKFLPFAESKVINANIKSVKLLTSGEDVKTVYDFELDMKNVNYHFDPGDTIGIIPANNPDEINKLFNRLNLNQVADRTYNLSIKKNTMKKSLKIPNHVDHQSTLRNLFLNNLDIRGVPKKLFLRMLSNYTFDVQEKQKITFLSNIQGTAEYNRFIKEEGKSLLQILNTFSSCFPPVERLLEYLPPLLPRPYSISSSPLKSTNTFHITVSVIDFNEEYKGVCSGWLEDEIKNYFSFNELEVNKQYLIQGDIKISFYFRKSNLFGLPEDSLTPIIMIGPGTGIAPFMGFLQHRFNQKKLNINVGMSWLYFGCRYSDRDFLYKSELQNYLKENILTKLFTSFSKEDSEIKYVQHNIIKYGKEFMEFFEVNKATVYICGDEKNMIKDIKGAILKCLINYRGKSEEEASTFLEELQKERRIVFDIWI